MQQDERIIFDRVCWRKRRARTAVGFGTVNFMKMEAAERLAERLEDISRRFPTALDLGCHQGELARALAGRGGIETLVQAEITPEFLPSEGVRVVCDDEWLPFGAETFDAVFSVLSLHWTNDLPGALIQARRALKPDGLFMAILPGARTLQELRQCLADAECEVEGGISPRVSPFVEVRDAGGLLQRAGFALPVIDSELVRISYPHALALMHELRAMGETNALMSRRRHFSRRATLLRAVELYQERYANEEGRVEATVELITLTGWAPHASQQQPARRGSGKVNLGDALKSIT
jgi:SAM-dependent methyltransferase